MAVGPLSPRQLEQPPSQSACCTPRLCNINPCSLICNFIDLLPSGPIWDQAKAQVRQHYASG